jgi:hypothetical protein
MNLELLNYDEFPDNIEFKILNYRHIIGGYISREKCKSELRRYGMKPDAHYDYYMPITKESFPLNLEVTVEVKTNLKLNVINSEGVSLLRENQK